jgi:hypothetical protein
VTKPKNFPGCVYLRWEGDPPYLIGSPDLGQASDSESKTLGMYRLQDEVETRQVTQFRPKGTKTWADDEDSKRPR